MRFVSVIRKYQPAFVWLGISAFFALFAGIYEHFSYGVYSAAMICAFLFPLLLGTVPCLIFRRSIGRLWNDGVLLLLFGSVLTGVFEIYGTASSYTPWFMIAGALCLAAGALTEWVRGKAAKRRARIGKKEHNIL